MQKIFDGKQTIKRKKLLPNPTIWWVFVLLRDNETREADEFYVIRLQELQDLVARDYNEMLIRHGGRRPKKSDSTHCILKPEELKNFRDRWDLLQSNFPPVSTEQLDERGEVARTAEPPVAISRTCTHGFIEERIGPCHPDGSTSPNRTDGSAPSRLLPLRTRSSNGRPSEC
jgi:hypothetical protein